MSSTRVELPDLLALRAAARAVDLSSRRRVMTDLGGAHLSGFRGRGMEFEEHRAYQPGDEVRTIDWRVTARTGEPHVRLYREERERPVIIAVDTRPAMAFGTRGCFKSVLAARAAAMVAWSAIDNGDRVGGLCFGSGVHAERRPGGGRRAALQFLHLLEQPPANAEPGEDLDDALKRLLRTVRPGSIVTVISDFRGLRESGHDLLKRLGRRAELIVGFVHDPLERELPPPGRYPVEDGDGEAVVVDSRRRVSRARWRRGFEGRHVALVRTVRGTGAHWLDLPTERPAEDSFRVALGRRRLVA